VPVLAYPLQYIAANTDVKVVFNGDGSDEASGSYMYFYNAPSDAAFEAEVERLLNDIHMFDVLRSDRSISTNGERR
jgi:asparagine synthase (glutamine-hydrolysing)